MWRGPMLGTVMRKFFEGVAWGPIDCLLAGLPPGTGDTALDLPQRLPMAQIAVVTTPQPAAAQVAARTGARRPG